MGASIDKYEDNWKEAEEKKTHEMWVRDFSCAGLTAKPTDNIENNIKPLKTIEKLVGEPKEEIKLHGDYKLDKVKVPHYRIKGIEPLKYIMANKMDFCEGNIIKYITRYKEKNGLEDLLKAKDYLNRLIENYD